MSMTTESSPVLEREHLDVVLVGPVDHDIGGEHELGLVASPVVGLPDRAVRGHGRRVVPPSFGFAISMSADVST